MTTPINRADDRETAPDDAVERVAREIGRLQGWRRWRDRDVAIGPLIAEEQRHAKRTERSLGAIANAWRECVPEDLASRTTLATFRAGTLTVKADTSAVAYQLDRALRAGLLTDLKRAFRGPLARVRESLRLV